MQAGQIKINSWLSPVYLLGVCFCNFLLMIFRFPVTNFLPKFLQILFFNKCCLVFPRILESLAQLSNLLGLPNSVETVVIALYFQHHPAWIYFKITDRNTRIIFKICSKLTGKTLKHQWCCSGVFAFNLEQVSRIVLAFNLLKLNKQRPTRLLQDLTNHLDYVMLYLKKKPFLRLTGFSFLLFSSGLPLVITAITAGVATDSLGPKTDDDIQL